MANGFESLFAKAQDDDLEAILMLAIIYDEGSDALLFASPHDDTDPAFAQKSFRLFQIASNRYVNFNA